MVLCSLFCMVMLSDDRWRHLATRAHINLWKINGCEHSASTAERTVWRVMRTNAMISY